MLRKLILLFILIPLSCFSLGTVSVYITNWSECLDINGTPVLGLSNYTNAHIEVGDSENRMYYEDIIVCVKDKYLPLEVLFGACTGGVVLRLHDPYEIYGNLVYFNFHGEIPEGSFYPNKLCLYHKNASILCGFGGNYEIYLVRLSSEANAHAELPNYTNYKYVIGCNLSYKDGTICDEDINCVSENCARDISNTSSVCTPKGYCYDGGNFYENLSCVRNNLCWNEEWISEGDFNEYSCSCVTSNNATWIEECCGDDALENPRTFKINYDYDLYLDEYEWKKGESIIGNYTISKNCYSDYCIIPENYVIINNTDYNLSSFTLGFLFYGKKDRKIIVKGNFHINITNGSLLLYIRGKTFVHNITEGWNYVLIVYDGRVLKEYINRQLVENFDFGSQEIIGGDNIEIYSKIDEFFLINRSLSLSEVEDLLSIFDNWTCSLGEKCFYNSTLYDKGVVLDNMTCSGRYWDKIPEIEISTDPSVVILDYGNSSNITIVLKDDDAREDWVGYAKIYDDLGEPVGYLNLSKSLGRKESLFLGSFEFPRDGYYDMEVNYGDRTNNITRIFENFIYVAKSAGLVDRIWIEPKVIEFGDNITITLRFRNDAYNLSRGTVFDLDFEGENYVVLEKEVLEEDLSNGTTINLTFKVRVLEEALVQNIIPLLKYNYSDKFLITIPKVIVWDINLSKSILYQGEVLRLYALPKFFEGDRVYNVNTTIKVYDSSYSLVLKRDLGVLDEVYQEIDTGRLPCDTYIISIEGRMGEYVGETATTFVVTGCYV